MSADLRSLVLSVSIALLGGLAWAEPVRLAGGDYPPLTGETEPGGGVLSQVVVAALAAQGVTVQITYLPWQRGFNETRGGLYAGTFPYVKNAERQSEFLFSTAMFTDTIRLFGLSSTALPVQWAHKSICVPLGYSIQQVQPFALAHGARLERPASMANCFGLLQLGRVHAVWASETVANQVTLPLRATGLQYKPLLEDVDYPVDYFFIAPKSDPNAAGLITRFNAGLAQIRKTGGYKKMMGTLVP
jgi:polar amino acid transport system substrate-binding protein